MPLRRTIGKWLLPSTAVALLLLAAGHAIRSQLPEPILPPPVTPSTNPFGNVVAGAGFVEPSTEASTVSIISVGSQLSGVITKVAVHIDQEVNEGDLLFQLDKRATNAQLKIRQAMLAAAEAQLAKLEKQPRPEEVPPLEAQLRASTASLATAIDIRNRDRKLVATKSITDEELFASEQTAATAQAQLELAQANLALLKAGAWQPDKDIARTAVDEAQAQLDETRTTLELLEVRAPVTGTILQVNVRSGEFVSASPTQSLVVMGNLKPYHVRVSIDEEDIPRLKLDAPGVAMLRGDLEQRRVPMKFVRIEPYVIPKTSLTGVNTERVDTRVMQVIYAIDPDEPLVRERKILVGQLLDVFIDVK